MNELRKEGMKQQCSCSGNQYFLEEILEFPLFSVLNQRETYKSLKDGRLGEYIAK